MLEEVLRISGSGLGRRRSEVLDRRIIEGDCLVVMDADGHPALKIRETLSEDGMEISLDGKVTVDASHDFEDEMISAASMCDTIRIDFKGLKSIASAGLKTLLSMQQILDQRPDTSLTLKGIRDDVLDTFNDTGFLGLFCIED